MSFSVLVYSYQVAALGALSPTMTGYSNAKAKVSDRSGIAADSIDGSLIQCSRRGPPPLAGPRRLIAPLQDPHDYHDCQECQ